MKQYFLEYFVFLKKNFSRLIPNLIALFLGFFIGDLMKNGFTLHLFSILLPVSVLSFVMIFVPTFIVYNLKLKNRI